MNDTRDPFNLSQLAGVEPPQDAWPDIAAGLQRQQRRQRVRRWGLGMSAAAAVTLALAVYWQLPQLAPVQGPAAGDPAGSAAVELASQDSAASPADTVTEESAATQASDGGNPAAPDSTSLPALVSLSQKLERNLRALRNETGAMPARAVMYQVELEDLVAQVDEAINMNPDSAELWSQRVNLLLDLNQLYRRQLRRDYSHVASL